MISKLVTVTPAKDEAQFIEDCIHSVMSQSYPVNFHLVIDDNSDDNTTSLVQNLAKKYPVMVIPCGFRKTDRQQFERPLFIQQKGVEKITSLIPNWQYLLIVDADTTLPSYYCLYLLNRMKANPHLVMAGASYLKTPKKLEKTSEDHVRSCNHIIKRGFYDQCRKSGKTYANRNGHLLLERYAHILGYEVRSFPLMANESRPTTIIFRPFADGYDSYLLGTPFLVMLSEARSKRGFLRLCGWLQAKLTNKRSYFSKKEKSQLRRWYFKKYFLR